MSAAERAAAAAFGAAGAVAACVVTAAVVDKGTRAEVAEAVATVAAAPALVVLAPFQLWGARRLTPEALARFVRAHYVSDGKPKFQVWTFALTKRTGVVWLRETQREGDNRWRAGSSEDFRPTVPLSDIFRKDTSS